jgi:hypothetical protein
MTKKKNSVGRSRRMEWTNKEMHAVLLGSFEARPRADKEKILKLNPEKFRGF